MNRPSVFQRKLKDLDLFKRLPKGVSKGTILGVLMTFICFVTIGLLVIHEFVSFFSTEIESGMRIEHRKEDKTVDVNIDVTFHRFPCPLLGLDVTDYVGTHRMNEHANLIFTNLAPNGEELGTANMDSDLEEVYRSHKEAYQKKWGCRIRGFFSILLVPGNFHIGFHSKGSTVQRLLDEGGPFEVDFTHTINHLYFEQEKHKISKHRLASDFNLKSVFSLNGYQSTAMAPSPGPFSYRYKLLIVPTDLVYENGEENDIFQYKSFWNVAAMEMQFNFLLSVDYELSSLSMVEKRKHHYWSEFIIHILGIIGGMVAFMSFVHNLIQKSVVKLLVKAGMGKLE